jgi:tetratricopeptide (TPR) repeat protein
MKRRGIFLRKYLLVRGHFTKDVQKVLMVMPIFASSASRDAIEAASDVHHFDFDEALGQLVQMWLVEVTDELEAVKRRYSIHPLTRAFGENKLAEKPMLLYKYKERLAEYLLEFSKIYGGQNWQSYDILELERENILSLITWLCNQQKWQHVIHFRTSIVDFLWVRGYWDDRLRYAFQIMEAAEKLNDQRTLAICMVYDLGWTFGRRGDLNIAKEWTNKGLQLFKKLNDQTGIALSFKNLGNITSKENNLDEAQELYRKGLNISEKAKLDISANLKLSFGMLKLKKGDHLGAQQYLAESISLFQNSNDHLGYASALFGFGIVEEKKGNRIDAKKILNQALEIARKIGRRDQIAAILRDLALVEENLNNTWGALKLAKEAREIFERLGMKVHTEQLKKIIQRLEQKI